MTLAIVLGWLLNQITAHTRQSIIGTLVILEYTTLTSHTAGCATLQCLVRLHDDGMETLASQPVACRGRVMCLSCATGDLLCCTAMSLLEGCCLQQALLFMG